MRREIVLFGTVLAVVGIGGLADAATANRHPAPASALHTTQITKATLRFQWKAPKSTSTQPRTAFEVYDDSTPLGHTTGSRFTVSDAKWKGVHVFSVIAYGKYGNSSEASMAVRRYNVGMVCYGQKNGGSFCIGVG